MSALCISLVATLLATGISDGTGPAVARRLATSQLPDGHWTGDSRFAPTALALRTISLFLPDEFGPERAERFARARQWLLATPATSTGDRANQLLALFYAGATDRDRQPFVDALLVLQRADGGWPQAAGMESDADVTGEVIHALRTTNALSSGALPVRFALRYLNHPTRNTHRNGLTCP